MKLNPMVIFGQFSDASLRPFHLGMYVCYGFEEVKRSLFPQRIESNPLNDSYTYMLMQTYPTGRKYLLELNFPIFANDKFPKILLNLILKF